MYEQNIVIVQVITSSMMYLKPSTGIYSARLLFAISDHWSPNLLHRPRWSSVSAWSGGVKLLGWRCNPLSSCGRVTSWMILLHSDIDIHACSHGEQTCFELNLNGVEAWKSKKLDGLRNSRYAKTTCSKNQTEQLTFAGTYWFGHHSKQVMQNT